MDIYELTGFKYGIDNSGVNFLDPTDAFELLKNGYVYRQELVSRKGFRQFATRLDDESRVMGIFENVLPDSTRQLLVCSKDYLYTYNEGTDAFDQIAFAGAASTFGITSDYHYVSGTTYLTKSGGQRFIFCSAGMSDIYYYDGTNVLSLTQDDPDYGAPTMGALTRATQVFWFGERLLFLVPVIAGVTYQQGILYSAIRDSSGNGDKFNVAGSGLLQADTYEILKGGAFLGDIMILNFQRSNWTLEKTRDAFNPFFVRKIPSVLGTDASFSAVSWNYEVKSVGNTGLISTDGRQSLRFDNLLPYFGSRTIKQENINLTYGGFDRINGQFLFSYLQADSSLSTQDKVLVYNYEESTFAINDQRFSCFGQTDNGMNIVWDDIDETVNPDWATWDGTEDIWNEIGLGEYTQKTLAGDNLGFVYQINIDYDDYFADISNITKASSAVITVAESAFLEGDRVIFENVEGMTEINGLIGTVTSASTTSLTVDIDSQLFTAYSAGGTVSKLIDFYAETSPFNPYRSEGRKVFVSHLEILLDNNQSDVYVDILMDGETDPFKTVLITSDAATNKKRKWNTVIVDQEADFITFVVRQETASKQVVITSMRIHAARGPMNAG